MMLRFSSYSMLKEAVQSSERSTMSKYVFIAGDTSIRQKSHASATLSAVQSDFLTSPEITSMFGEVIAAFLVDRWHAMGSPPHLHYTELGPGRGTLAKDIVSTFMQLSRIPAPQLSVHLIELSPALKIQQAKALGCSQNTEPNCFYHSMYGNPVYWHGSLDNYISSIPTGSKAASFFMAHEFFDALPVHVFKKVHGTEDTSREGVRARTSTSALRDWREVLVDVDSQGNLQPVLSRTPTYACTSLLRHHYAILNGEDVTHCEISPLSALTIEKMARVVCSQGGCGLVIDYCLQPSHTPGGGAAEPPRGKRDRDSLRAFRAHTQCDPFKDPGKVDLTADVDFEYLLCHLQSQAENLSRLSTYGPISQGDFLVRNGGQQRLEYALLLSSSATRRTLLRDAFDLIASPRHMGGKFGVVYFQTNHVSQPHCFLTHNNVDT